MRSIRTALVLLLALCAAPLCAYTVYLKDGSKISAREPYVVEGEKAIITLLNGTRTSIDAAEIDVQRTREANRSDYGSAMVLEDGRLTELPPDSPAPREQSLGDLIGQREPSAQSRPPAIRAPAESPAAGTADRDSAGTVDFQTLSRTPYRNIDLASELQRVFRAQGVEEVMIYQGSRTGSLLIDITANSEASVFRALEVASDALLHLRDDFPGQVEVFELSLTTSDREPAGQFLLGVGEALRLAAGEVETSTFFIENVRF